MTDRFDAVIVGSGFSGSMLGWILAKQGWKVLLIDSGRHPRFAIGESSTPTADFLIHHIASRWGLDKLAPLASWGSWKGAYPDLLCGKKRGFSYYKHHKDQRFVDDAQHSQSFLVAASSEDRFSDTHWVRSSVDQFLVQSAVDEGAILREGTSLHSAKYDRVNQVWTVGVRGVDGVQTIAAPWLIDASGGGTATADLIDNPLDDDWMRTRTRATFAHFDGVLPFNEGRAADDPFCGDDAAQHHLTDNGWWWMLRFDNGITSVGLVEKLNSTSARNSTSVDDFLQTSRADYPSIAGLMHNSKVVAPIFNVAGSPTSIACAIQSGRLSRCRTKASAPGLILLPNAYGFVDPLHSTGIAHALSGVVRAAKMLTGPTQSIDIELYEYNFALRREIRWLDTLIAGCYFALPNFQRFVAFSSFYFVAAIRFEAVMAEDPALWPAGFLQADDAMMVESTELSIREVNDPSISDDDFTSRVRDRISRWNTAGLLDPQNRNRLNHTAAPKW